MGGFVPSIVSGVASSFISKKIEKPTPVAAPVAAPKPKPVVTPNTVVKAGEASAAANQKKASIRRGAVRRRVPKSVLGSSPSASKTLLGE